MKPEDYPAIEFRGRKLLAVPELPESPESLFEPESSGSDYRCAMCLLERSDCIDLTNEAAHQMGDETCGDLKVVFVPEENFTEYVVEFVRRRVS